MSVQINKNFFTSTTIGLSSGLCYALLVSTFTAYLSENNVAIAMIGFLSLRTLPYSFKYLWSPVVDAMHINLFPRGFGQRKSWMIAMQCCLIICIIMMGVIDIHEHLYLVCSLAFLTSFFAATFDIAMDAYRIEIFRAEGSANVNSFVVLGYRLGFLISGALGLYISTIFAWKWVFVFIACCLIPCMVVILFSEDKRQAEQEYYTNFRHWFKVNVITPFGLLFRSPKFYLVFLTISFYKVSDGYLDTLLIPFLLEMNFSVIDIATISRTIGLVAFIAGTFAGTYIINKYSLFTSLLNAEFFAAITNLLFIILVNHKGDKELLIAIICAENFCAGICNIALISYMSSLCRHKKFTATHYAILISISGLSRALLGATSGVVAEEVGWVQFFIISALLSIPSLVCVLLLKQRQKPT